MELQVLCVAAQEGDVQVVAAWLDDGGGVDERCAEHEGATLLFAAAYGGQGAVVRMLLARGASVNLQDFHGITAIRLPARRRRAVQEVPDLRPALRRAAGGGARHARARGAHLRAAQVVPAPGRAAAVWYLRFWDGRVYHSVGAL